MTWKITVLLMMVAVVMVEILIKRAANKLPHRAIGVFYQYFFCALIALTYASLFWGMGEMRLVLAVGAIGVINSLGNYYQWQAYKISLSKTALFLPLTEVAAIFLAFLFLNEATVWNIQLLVGVSLCFLAIWLLRFREHHQSRSQKIEGHKWFFYTLSLILIFGLVTFAMKVFSLGQVEIGTFLAGWYVGGAVGSSLLLLSHRENPFPLTRKIFATVLPVSISLVTALGLVYWTLELGGPLSQVLPLRGLSSSLIPALVGLYFFKEQRQLSQADKFAFALGLLGAVLILLR